jgi:hypothetical protein
MSTIDTTADSTSKESNSTDSILENYKNHRFTEDEEKELSSSFLGFVEVLKISYRLIKDNLLNGFLVPFLLNLGLGFVAVIFFGIIGVLFLFSLFSGINFETLTNLTNDLNSENPELITNSISELTNSYNGSGLSFLVIFLLFSLFSIIISVVAYFIYFKQLDFLANNQKTSIFEGMFENTKTFFEMILGNIFVFLLNLPFLFLLIVSLVFSFFSLAVGAINLLVAENPTTIENNQFLERLAEDSPSGVGIFLRFLLFIFVYILFIVAVMVIQGFVGLFEMLILKEGEGAWSAIKKSFEISKKYYFQNALRWFLFYIVVFIITMLLSFITSILRSIFADIAILSALIGLTSWILDMLINLTVLSFTITFYLVSFYNFRFIFEKEKVIVEEKEEENEVIVS